MPGGTGPGGAPQEWPEGHWGIGGLSGPDRMLQPMRRALGEIAAREQRIDAIREVLPQFSASMSGATRDYLSQAVGLLRFGANVQGFEFTPSIAIVAKDLMKLAMALKDFRVPLTRSVKQVMMPSIEQTFATGGRGEWEPLAPNTVQKHRAKLGLGPTPILVRRGRLKAAATSFNIWSINPISAVVKALPKNVWYGNIHQLGYGDYGVSASSKASASWFKPYQDAARKVLVKRSATGRASSEFSRATVDNVAWQIFNKRLLNFGPGVRKGQMAIPPRRFIVFQEDDFTQIQRIFYDWLDEQIVLKGGWPPPRG